MKLLRLTIILFCFSTCAPIYVNYDFEKGTDFTKYKTYNYYSDMEPGLSQLDTKRLLDAIDIELKKQGFILADNPDFFIDIKQLSIVLIGD